MSIGLDWNLDHVRLRIKFNIKMKFTCVEKKNYENSKYCFFQRLFAVAVHFLIICKNIKLLRFSRITMKYVICK